MLVQATFGVNSEDVEEARAWVEAATGLVAEARESSERGGDYYLFEGVNGETVRLVSNRDLYDEEPVTTAPIEWVLALEIEETGEDSEILRGIASATSRFVQVEIEKYE